MEKDKYLQYSVGVIRKCRVITERTKLSFREPIYN